MMDALKDIFRGTVEDRAEKLREKLRRADARYGAVTARIGALEQERRANALAALDDDPAAKSVMDRTGAELAKLRLEQEAIRDARKALGRELQSIENEIRAEQHRQKIDAHQALITAGAAAADRVDAALRPVVKDLQFLIDNMNQIRRSYRALGGSRDVDLADEPLHPNTLAGKLAEFVHRLGLPAKVLGATPRDDRAGVPSFSETWARLLKRYEITP